MRHSTHAWMLVGALALTGCPEAPSEDGAEGSGESTAESAEGASAEETGEAPEAGESALPEVAASVPTDVLGFVPQSTDMLVLVDMASIRTFGLELFGMDEADVLTEANEEALTAALAEMVGVTPDLLEPFNFFEVDTLAIAADINTETVLLVTEAAAFHEPPEDGADPAQVGLGQLAIRGDWAIYGMGSIHSEALAPDGEMLDPASAWAAGWDAIPSDSAITLFLPDIASAPEGAQRDFMVGDAQIQRLAFGVPLSGLVRVAIESDQPDLTSRLLGSLQVGTMEGVAELRDEGIPEAAGGWANYFELLVRSFWSQVELEAQGNVSVVGFSAPRCGTAWTYPAILGLASTLVRQGGGSFDEEGNWVEADPLADAPAFEPMDARIADDCGPLDGPAPNLPLSLTRLAPTDGDGFLVLMDVGGAMRAQLPRAGGLLPFAMHHEDIASALGETPLGLDGLADPEGSGAMYMPMSAMMGEPSVVAVAWPGFDNLLDDDIRAEMNEDATVAVRDGLGWTVTTADLAERFDAEVDVTSNWYRLVESLPNSTVSAIVATPMWPDDAVNEIPEGGLRDLVASVTMFVYAADGRGVPTLRAMVDGDPETLASAAQSHALALLNELTTQMAGEMGAIEMMTARLGDMVRFVPVGDDMIGLELNIDPSLAPMLPMAMGAGMWVSLLAVGNDVAVSPQEATSIAAPVQVESDTRQAAPPVGGP